MCLNFWNYDQRALGKLLKSVINIANGITDLTIEVAPSYVERNSNEAPYTTKYIISMITSGRYEREECRIRPLNLLLYEQQG